MASDKPVKVAIELHAKDRNTAVCLLNLVLAQIARGESKGYEFYRSEVEGDDAWGEWDFSVERSDK